MGRPRSARAHAQVLDAAGRLFADQGIDATSMDAIAAAAGVSKATIYRHWPDKGALCLEVVASMHPERPAQASDDVRADILAFLEYQPPKPHPDVRSRIMPHLMAYAVRHPEFGAMWRSRAVDPPRARLVSLLKRAVAERKLEAGLDLDTAAVALIGPIMYRNFLRLTGGDVSKDLPRRILDAFWKAHGRAPVPRRQPTRR